MSHLLGRGSGGDLLLHRHSRHLGMLSIAHRLLHGHSRHGLAVRGLRSSLLATADNDDLLVVFGFTTFASSDDANDDNNADNATYHSSDDAANSSCKIIQNDISVDKAGGVPVSICLCHIDVVEANAVPFLIDLYCGRVLMVPFKACVCTGKIIF